MKKRRLIWAAIILTTVGITLLSWIFRPPPDPVFNGRLESMWIESLKYSDEFQAEQWREFGPEGLQVLVRGLERTERPLERKYRSFYRRAPARLQSILPSPKMDETRSRRMILVKLIADLAPESIAAVPVMTRMLLDEDLSVRQLALGFFSRTESDQAILHKLEPPARKELLPLIWQFAHDPHEGLRNNALVVLMLYQDEPAALQAVIHAALHDPIPRIREFTGKHLRFAKPEMIAEAGGVEAALAALHHPQPHTAFNAARLLGEKRLKPELAIPALLQTVQHTNAAIAQEALRSIGRFPENAVTSIEALKVVLQDPAVKHPEAIRHLIEKLQQQLESEEPKGTK